MHIYIPTQSANIPRGPIPKPIVVVVGMEGIIEKNVIVKINEENRRPPSIH